MNLSRLSLLVPVSILTLLLVGVFATTRLLSQPHRLASRAAESKTGLKPFINLSLYQDQKTNLILVSNIEIVQSFSPIISNTYSSDSLKLDELVNGTISYSTPFQLETLPHTHGLRYKPETSSPFFNVIDPPSAQVKIPYISKDAVFQIRLKSSTQRLTLPTTISDVLAHQQLFLAPVNRSPVITRKVMVINYDPIIESAGNRPLHEVLGWNDPVNLESQYITEINTLKSTNYSIASRLVLDAFPPKISGYQFTDTSYLACWNDHSLCNSDIINYQTVLSQYQVCEKRNAGQIDELWLWGGPWFGYKESKLAGPHAFYYNSLPLTGTTCTKQLPIMGFNYERTVAQMLHSMGHRVEFSSKHLFQDTWNYQYGVVPQSRPSNLSSFDKFTARGFDVGINAGCGDVHGFLNTQQVPPSTYGSDWSNYNDYEDATCNYFPLSTTLNTNCSRWGCNEHDFVRMWFNKLPNTFWGRALDFENPPVTGGDIELPRPTQVLWGPLAGGNCTQIFGQSLAWSSVPSATTYTIKIDNINNGPVNCSSPLAGDACYFGVTGSPNQNSLLFGLPSPLPKPGKFIATVEVQTPGPSLPTASSILEFPPCPPSPTPNTNPLSAPSVSISGVYSSFVNLNWGYPGNQGVWDVHIEQCTGDIDCNDFSEVKTVSNTMFTSIPVTPGIYTSFTIRTHRHTDNAFSPYSATSTAMPMTYPSLSTSISCNNVTLSWASIPGATNYHISRCTGVPCSPDFQEISTTTATSYSDLALPGGVYQYRVRPYNSPAGNFGDAGTTSPLQVVGCRSSPTPALVN